MNTNTPLLLASVALLAGVAARPINNDRRATDDLRELVRSPGDDDRQAFLGRIPSGFDSLNSLQLHDIHDNTNAEADSNASKSPKLSGVDPASDPDPGFDSPYMGPQRHLAGIEQELASPSATLTLEASSPLSPPARSTQQSRLSGTGPEPEYSRTVVILVFSSLAALVLLGLTVAVIGVTQLLRRTMLREDVWNSVAGGRGGEKEKDVSGSENEKVERGRGGSGTLLEAGGSKNTMTGVIAARELSSNALSRSLTTKSTKSDTSVDDPDVMPLPETPSPSSAPAIRDGQRTMGLALAWTYDNWVTHFMMALFGWFGVLFGGAGDRR